MSSSSDCQWTNTSAGTTNDGLKFRRGSCKIIAIIVLALVSVVLCILVLAVVFAVLILLTVVRYLGGSVNGAVLEFFQTKHVNVALFPFVPGTKQ